jgi:hypothetical protein
MPDVYYRRMAALAAWMEYSGAAVCSVAPGPYPEQCNVPVTVGGDRRYMHCSPGFEAGLLLKDVGVPKSVTLLRTGELLPSEHVNQCLRIIVPPERRSCDMDVVVVDW